MGDPRLHAATYARRCPRREARSPPNLSVRKEVIQPQVPLRLPCYDLVLITDPTFDSSLLTVRPLASGVTDFHDLTGGVYKAQEHIHRGVADPRLLAIPTSCRRVAADNPNWGRVSGICSTLRIRNPLSRTIVARV